MDIIPVYTGVQSCIASATTHTGAHNHLFDVHPIGYILGQLDIINK